MSFVRQRMQMETEARLRTQADSVVDQLRKLKASFPELMPDQIENPILAHFMDESHLATLAPEVHQLFNHLLNNPSDEKVRVLKASRLGSLLQELSTEAAKLEQQLEEEAERQFNEAAPSDINPLDRFLKEHYPQGQSRS